MRDSWPEDWRMPDVDAHDIAAAFALLTRLPVPVDHARAADRAAAAAWAFPLVGAAVGLLAGALGWVLAALGLPGAMAGGVALAAMVLMTGGLHEDGLADCADGFGGGQTTERRLEIMKDSRVGAFGVLALVLALLLRWSGIEALIDARAILWLGAVGAVSRLPMTLTMWAMPLARRGGLAASVGMVAPATAALAGGVALVLAVLLGGLAGLAMLLAALAAGVAVCWIAWRRIEGYTGDVLGAAQQAAEVAALAIAAALV